MALFGRPDPLAEALRKLEADGGASQAEIDALLETVGSCEEFRIERALWMVRSPSRKVREFAAAALARSPEPGALAPALVREVAAAPPVLRPEAARIAFQAAGRRIAALLPALLHAPEPERRDAGLELLAARDDARSSLPLLRTALRDPEPELRRKAVRLLARGVHSPGVFVVLRGLIHDDDLEVRRAVIASFARHGGPGIVEPFFERIALEGEHERAVIVAALSALARSAQEQVEERVLPILSDESAAVRELALRLLLEMPDRTRLLRAFLLHCRGLAFWLRDRSLASIRSIAASLVEPLMELMREGEEEDVRVGAMLLARDLGDERVAPLVRGIFTSNLDWWVRNTAAEVLAAHPGGEVTRLLISRIGDPDLRYGIIALLGSREGEEAEAALLGCLEDANRGVRRAAIAALAQRGGERALAAIAALAAEDPDPAVRERAGELLAGCGGGERGAAARTPQAAVPSPGDAELSMENDELNAPRGSVPAPAVGPEPGEGEGA